MKLDSFHPNRFLGNPEMTRDIQRRYIPYFKQGGRVLDVGCGTGVFLNLLKENGRVGVGIDITKEYIDDLKRQGFEGYCENIFDFLATHTKTYDGIFASHFIEHFSTKDGLPLIENFYNMLNPGGVLVLITPAFHDILVNGERFWCDITHVRPYPLALLEAIYEHLDLEILSKGYDPNTRTRHMPNHPRAFLRYYWGKLRWGKYYEVGDTFIIGKKK